MIQDGDYIRSRSTGQLHKVKLAVSSKYYTAQVPTGDHSEVKKEDAVKVKLLALLPGDPEVTEREAA